MALLLLVAGGYGFAADLYVGARDLVALREDRELLAAEVERLKMKLAVESATRLQLEKQAAELNAQVAELNGQVKFLMVRKAPDKIVE
jgi:hypothetical protein